MAMMITGLKFAWPGFRVPFEVADDILLDATARTVLNIAINTFNNNVRYNLVARTEDEPNYVVFRLHPTACKSPVGRQTGKQFVNCPILAGTTFSVPAVMHEIGHAVGLYHEHQRPDRNLFVSVSASAITSQPEDFNTVNAFILTAYDCNSLMHYPTIPGSITPLPGGCGSIGGTTLSVFDITALNGWEQLDNNAATSLILIEQSLYQLHKMTGRMFRFVGPPLTGWEELDNNPVTEVLVADGGRLYSRRR